MLASPEAWDTVVRGGALVENGMASFAEVLDENSAEAVRAYVIARANERAAR